jgi:RNA polymerase sigma factor (sigma-70 family)
VNDRDRQHWVITHILPHEGEVRGWLRKYVRTLGRADIDDLIQKAYTRLCHADFHRILNGRSYLFTTVRHLVHEQVRRSRIVAMERMGEIEALRIPSEEPGPERRISARQELERLDAIVKALPEQCQRAFRLQKFSGLSVREIAVAMQISEKTVEKHLTAALTRVLHALKDEPVEQGSPRGVADDDHEQSKD